MCGSLQSSHVPPRRVSLSICRVYTTCQSHRSPHLQQCELTCDVKVVAEQLCPNAPCVPSLNCIECPLEHTHHAFPVIHSRQILLKLFAHVEVHVVVLEGAEGLDDDVVSVVADFLVRLQQGCDFPDGDIHICGSGKGKRTRRREVSSRVFQCSYTTSGIRCLVLKSESERILYFAI